MPKINIEEEIKKENELMSDKDTETLLYFNTRYKDMKDQRLRHEPDFYRFEKMVDAPVPESTDWKAQVNVKLEQSVLEMRCWLIPSNLPYKVMPDWLMNMDILEPAKYVMDFFVDKENVIEEVKRWDYNKGKYGSWILYTGLRFETRTFSEAIEWDDIYTQKTKESKKVIRHIWTIEWNIRKAWFDERAIQMKECMDEILQEDISPEEFILRYTDDNWKQKKWFKYIFSVWTSTNEYTYWKSRDRYTDNKRNVVIHHYYNKLSWKYYIVANESFVIFSGKMLSKHWELPAQLTQEFPRTDDLYGYGFCHKCQTSKAYINNLFKAALDKTWNASWSAIINVWSENQDWEFFLDPWETQIWNFVWWSSQVIPFQPNADTTPHQNMMRLVEEWNLKQTWISIDPQALLSANTAFQAWLFVEEQTARLKVNNEMRNIWLDKALTLMLCNISQFAPYLYADHVFWDDSKVKNFNWLKIRVADIKYSKKTKRFKDKPGYYDFFDLDNKLFPAWAMMSVRIDTPTTQTIMKNIEKWVLAEQMQAIVQVFQLDPEQAKSYVEPLMQKIVDVYEIPNTKMYKKQDENKEQINNIIDSVKLAWWNVLPPNTEFDDKWTGFEPSNGWQGWVPQA